MKKLFLLFTALIAMMAFSCTDDDPNDPTVTAADVTSLSQVVGLWKSSSGQATYKATAEGLYYHYSGRATITYFISNEGATTGDHFGFYGKMYDDTTTAGSFTDVVKLGDGADGYGALIFDEVTSGVSITMEKIGAPRTRTGASGAKTEADAKAGASASEDSTLTTYTTTSTDPF